MHYIENKKPIVTYIVAFIISVLSAIPLYNRLLTHQRDDRYDFDIQTMLAEYALVVFLVLLFLLSKPFKPIGTVGRQINRFTIVLTIYILLSLVSVFFSGDFQRSFGLYFFGMLGPYFLYLIIVYRTSAKLSGLNLMMLAFLFSNIILLIISYLFLFRFGLTTDLLENRAGKNIYGSNSVVGTLCFLLPMIFVNTRNFIFPWMKKLFPVFALMSLSWTLIALSRWGYVSLLFAFVATSYFVNKSIYAGKIALFVIVFSIVWLLIPDISSMIVYRFTGDEERFTTEAVVEKTTKEARFIRWENAIEYYTKHPYFGIGLGNHHLIDFLGSPDAHNLFLNMMLEQGIFVFISFFLVLVGILKLIILIKKYVTDKRMTNIAFALGVGIFAFHFWSLTGGAHIQAGGIISAVKNYYFFVTMGLIVFILRVNTEDYYKNIQ